MMCVNSSSQFVAVTILNVHDTINHTVLKRRDIGRYHTGIVPLDIIALIGTLRYNMHRSVEVNPSRTLQTGSGHRRTNGHQFARSVRRVSELAPERLGSFM